MITQEEIQKSQRKKLISKWLAYQSLVKHLPYFLFLTLGALIYIYNGHYADKTERKIYKTKKELKFLQHEYKTIKSEVLFRSKQSEIAKIVAPLGLKELGISPYVLSATKIKQP